MKAPSQEGQRQDLSQEAELRAQVPPLRLPVTQGGWRRGGLALFRGSKYYNNHNPIPGMPGTAQSPCFYLFYPENNTHKKEVLSSSPPFYRGPTQSTERLINLPTVTSP